MVCRVETLGTARAKYFTGWDVFTIAQANNQQQQGTAFLYTITTGIIRLARSVSNVPKTKRYNNSYGFWVVYFFGMTPNLA